MRERLLGSSGVDWSRVYVCDEGGRLSAASGSVVFYWDDLVPFSSHVVESGGARAREAAGLSGVSVDELVRCWRLVHHFGELIGEPVQRVAMSCPSCGGDDVADDGSEDCEPGSVERWHMCHDCGTTWTDTYVIAARTVLTSGKPVAVSVPVVGPADHLDMAYEDRNGCGVEL